MKTTMIEGDRLQLTRKEQELLELLEGNPGRCFSRGFLLRSIWGYSDDTKTRTVDVHVSRLRKKLSGRKDVAIHTVVRQGYVLEQLNGGGRSSLITAQEAVGSMAVAAAGGG